MIKMKKSAALILAGVLACSMPMPVMASSDTEVVESLLDSGIDFLASDPGKAVDIIMYAKDLVDQQNITDDQVRSAVTQAADCGVKTLHGAAVQAQELRGGASLILAALGAKGVTVLEGYSFVQRGYEHICQDLNALGAAVKRIQE